MNHKVIEIAQHLFTKYIDCEKSVMCGEHIIDKQPAISKNNFNNLLKHIHSAYYNDKTDSEKAYSDIFDIVTDLLRDDINKGEAVKKLLNLYIDINTQLPCAPDECSDIKKK